MSTLHRYWMSKTAWILQRNVRILLAIIDVLSDECTTKTEGGTHMEIKYNVTGTNRKELVNVISKATGMKAVYKFMPTCNFEIGCFTVNKEGTLLIDALADHREVARVLEAIAAAGFEHESLDTEEAPAEEDALSSMEDATETMDMRCKDLSLPIVSPERLKVSSAGVTDWIKANGIKYLAVHWDLDVLDPADFRSIYPAEPYLNSENFPAAVGRMTLNDVTRILKDSSAIAPIVGLSITEHLPWDAFRLREALSQISIFKDESLF